MANPSVRAPAPYNEPVLSYAPGTPERASLVAELARQSAARVDIPVVVDGQELRTGRVEPVTCPHRHAHILADSHQASSGDVARAIDGALRAGSEWSRLSLAERSAIFLRAADLLCGRHRARLNAATMLGQSKTAHQAEIDAACETADFFRWNVHFAERIAAEQPVSPPGQWNQSEARPLEGFVFAVTPFNFTSIAANLPTAPALMGCSVVWKPAHASMLSSWVMLDILREAGLPDGVIQFVPGAPTEVADVVLAHPLLAGIHFTGSTGVFRQLWRKVAERLESYRSYPRLVGETGGKDFILAHPSVSDDGELEALAVAIVRGAFEFQGQKCSAASRIYVPDSRWPRLRERIVELTRSLRQGDPAELSNFLGAVIDARAFARLRVAQEEGRSSGYTTLVGGGAHSETGWFIEPTIVQAEDPKARLMTEELFGPLATVYVYPESKWHETLTLVDETGPYALTGALFCRDRAAIVEAKGALVQAAGNFYINDKPTGAVVGQQPFGGGRASGTNDKAGSLWNLVRWISPRTVKETADPPRVVEYPFQRSS